MSKETKTQSDALEQYRALLRGQKLRLWLTVAVALVLFAAVGYLWHQVDTAYDSILQTSAQVNEVAGRLQQSLDTLDTEQLDSMLQDLPQITEKLAELDVDALNEVLVRMPELMDAVSDLQQRMEGLQSFFSGFGSGLSGLFGGR